MNKIHSLENIVYVKRGTNALRLDLHRPVGATKLLPVIVGIPGGGWCACAKENVPLYLASHGFAMACINYRVSSEAIAPANIRDCKAAVRWLRSNAKRLGLDPEQIGACGGSAGGHLAALLGISTGIKELEGEPGDPFFPSTSVKAVCALCGPMDLTRIASPAIRKKFPTLYDVTTQYLGGPIQQRIKLAQLVSPLTYVSKKNPPMLLIHGAADPVIPVEESRLFHAALKKAGAKSTLRVVQRMGHGGLWEACREDIISFFKKHLTP